MTHETLQALGSNAGLDEGRLIIEVFDADGVCVERSVGPSNAELKAAHDAGECGAWCAHCYTEACFQLEHGAVSNACGEPGLTEPGKN